MPNAFADSDKYKKAVAGYSDSTKLVSHIDDLLSELARTTPGNKPDWLQKTSIPRNMASLLEPKAGDFLNQVVSKPDLLKQKSFELADQQIMRAAAALFDPGTPVPTPMSVPRLPLERALAGASPIAALLELLTYSGDLNSNEEQELAKRRAQPPTK